MRLLLGLHGTADHNDDRPGWLVRRENRQNRSEVFMCELSYEQVRLIQQALNEDKRKEVVLKIENGKIVILCVHKKRIG